MFDSITSFNTIEWVLNVYKNKRQKEFEKQNFNTL